jgi:hypothetical protein
MERAFREAAAVKEARNLVREHRPRGERRLHDGNIAVVDANALQAMSKTSLIRGVEGALRVMNALAEATGIGVVTAS